MSGPIKVDGKSFVGADLRSKMLVYEGGPVPDMLNAQLDKTGWTFSEAAGRTMAMVAMLNIMQPGFAVRMIEEFTKQLQIRHGKPPH